MLLPDVAAVGVGFRRHLAVFVDIEVIGAVVIHHDIDADVGAVVGDLFKVVDDIKEGDAVLDGAAAVLEPEDMLALKGLL